MIIRKYIGQSITDIFTIGTPSMLQATLLKSIGWSSNKGIPPTPSGSDVSSLVISAATVSCYTYNAHTQL